MKKMMILIGIGLLFTITACSGGSKGDMEDELVKVGKDIVEEESTENKYDFTLIDLDGEEYRLQEMKGENVYVKFWASWCPVCLSGLNDLNEMAGGSNDFEIITIVSPDHNGEKSKEDFIEWFNSLEYKNIKVLLDETGDVFRNYGVRSMPTNAIINSDGDVLKVIPGEIKKDTIEKIFKEVSQGE